MAIERQDRRVVAEHDFRAPSIGRAVEALQTALRQYLGKPLAHERAAVAALGKFAVRCGVGNSLRALASGHAAIARVLAEAGPEHVIRDLAEADIAGLGISGLHFFTFGGAGRTAAMIRTMLREAA